MVTHGRRRGQSGAVQLREREARFKGSASLRRTSRNAPAMTIYYCDPGILRAAGHRDRRSLVGRGAGGWRHAGYPQPGHPHLPHPDSRTRGSTAALTPPGIFSPQTWRDTLRRDMTSPSGSQSNHCVTFKQQSRNKQHRSLLQFGNTYQI